MAFCASPFLSASPPLTSRVRSLLGCSAAGDFCFVFSAENTKQKSPAAEHPSKERTLLVKGGDALKKGEAQKAITEYFDPVIQHYTEIYKGETKRIYSA